MAPGLDGLIEPNNGFEAKTKAAACGAEETPDTTGGVEAAIEGEGAADGGFVADGCAGDGVADGPPTPEGALQAAPTTATNKVAATAI